MDLRQLAALVAIADHGSFSAAARALYTVQSNVSTHIARLEKELGVHLVDRSSGTLTEEGDIVIERARRILHELDDITADIASRDDEVAGDTRLGVIGTTGRWLMPQFLTALGVAHPKVRPLVFEGSTSTLLPRLVSGQIDAAIVHLPVDDPELTVDPLFAEDLVLLTPGRHHLAESGREEMSLRELANEPLLLPPRSAGLRRVIDRAASQVDVSLVPQAEIDGVRMLASLAFEGFGAAIVPATAVPRWLKGDFRRITVPELPRRVVGWVERRRPRPNRPTLAASHVAKELILARGARQPGLYVGPDAFPLSRG
jgi:DNA-binding transcriptional LysR family regulator